MKEPYHSINDLPFDDHGWFLNARQLEKLIQDHAPKIVIEVGSWLGKSTRFIASKISDQSLLYAIDTWKGSLNEVSQMEDPRISFLYQLFLSNVKHAKLTEKIIPIRMESLEAASALNVSADLIYIDASHDAHSVYKDVLAWMPHLNKHGVICGDDWSMPSVKEGVTLAAEVLNQQLHGDENFWRFI